jgi:hypothetical protein
LGAPATADLRRAIELKARGEEAAEFKQKARETRGARSRAALIPKAAAALNLNARKTYLR